ncbi:MAG: sulfur carrier protein ThiS [Acidiferrobacteraceae bacterium]
MRITVNGHAHDIESRSTVATLLAHLRLGEKRVAVEVNREIVPRGAHDTHELRESDRVEIVRAVGGG